MVPAPSNISSPIYLHTYTNRVTEDGTVFWTKKDFGPEHFILNPQLSLQIINNIINRLWRLRSRLYFRQDSLRGKPLWGLQVQMPEVLAVDSMFQVVTGTALSTSTWTGLVLMAWPSHQLAGPGWLLASDINCLDLVPPWPSGCQVHRKQVQGLVIRNINVHYHHLKLSTN